MSVFVFVWKFLKIFSRVAGRQWQKLSWVWLCHWHTFLVWTLVTSMNLCSSHTLDHSPPLPIWVRLTFAVQHTHYSEWTKNRRNYHRHIQEYHMVTWWNSLVIWCIFVECTDLQDQIFFLMLISLSIKCCDSDILDIMCLVFVCSGIINLIMNIRILWQKTTIWSYWLKHFLLIIIVLAILFSNGNTVL